MYHYVNTAALNRHPNLAAHTGHSALGAWLKTTLQRLMASTPVTPPPRDPVREAAEVRTLAESIRSHDPRFAADLFAAADRHEALGL